MTTNETQFHEFTNSHEKTTIMITEGKAFILNDNSWEDANSFKVTMQFARICYKTKMDRVRLGDMKYKRY